MQNRHWNGLCLAGGVAAALAAFSGVSSPAVSFAANPSLTLISTSAAAESGHLVFKGSGWPSFASLSIKVLKGESDIDDLCSVQANASGNLPQSSCAVGQYIPGGSYTMEAISGVLTAVSSTTVTITPTVIFYGLGNTRTHVAAEGQTITVAGYGFTVGTPAVTAKFNGVKLPLAGSTSTNSYGQFPSATFVTPSTTTGKVPVVFTDKSSRSTSTNLTVYKPTIATSATSISAGNYVTVSGNGWPAVDQINIYADLNGVNTFLCAAFTDSGGTIGSISCAVGYSLAHGNYSLVAADSHLTTTSATTFMVNPTVHLFVGNNPTTKASPGITITAYGYSFAPGATVTAKLGSTSLTLSGSNTTTGSGALGPVTFTIPASASSGTQSVTLTDAGNNKGVFKLAIYKAAISVTGTSAPGDTPLTFRASGFPASDTLYLNMVNVNGSVQQCSPVTDDGGSLDLETCTISPYTPYGTYNVVLTDGYVSATASAQFKVTPYILTYQNSGLVTSAAKGSTVVMNGCSFSPNVAFTAKLGSTTLSVGPSATLTSYGSFATQSFTVPKVADKTYTLTVQDANGRSTSEPFTVTG